jgi:hypothetical protein
MAGKKKVVDIVKPAQEFKKAFKEANDKYWEHREAVSEWYKKRGDDKSTAAKAKARAAALTAIANSKAKTAAFKKAFDSFKKQNQDKIKSDADFRRNAEEIDRRIEGVERMLRLLEEDATSEQYKLMQA